MKLAGPDLAVCLEEQVAGPMANGRGGGGPCRKAGLLPSCCGGAAGHHVWSDHSPFPSSKRSCKFRFSATHLRMLKCRRQAGNVKMIREDQITYIWSGCGLAQPLSESRDLSLHCCAQQRLLRSGDWLHRSGLSQGAKPGGNLARRARSMQSPPPPAPLPGLATSQKGVMVAQTIMVSPAAAPVPCLMQRTLSESCRQ